VGGVAIVLGHTHTRVLARAQLLVVRATTPCLLRLCCTRARRHGQRAEEQGAGVLHERRVQVRA
jgi:hypothetical protein